MIAGADVAVVVVRAVFQDDMAVVANSVVVVDVGATVGLVVDVGMGVATVVAFVVRVDAAALLSTSSASSSTT